MRERLPGRDWLVWQLIQVERRGIECLAADPELQEAVREYLEERNAEFRRIIAGSIHLPSALLGDLPVEVRRSLELMQQQADERRAVVERILEQTKAPAFTDLTLPVDGEALAVTSFAIEEAEQAAAQDRVVEVLLSMVGELERSNVHLEQLARRAAPAWVTYTVLGVSVAALLASVGALVVAIVQLVQPR